MKEYIDNNRAPAGHEEKIVYINPKDLVPYENNPRMNDNGVQPVIESIKAYGFKVPIVVDGNNVVICGHTRLKAALQMGLDSVPCIIADDLSAEQVKAFRIADNKVSDFSIWDNKLLLEELTALDDTDWFTGFDFADLDGLDVLNEKDNSAVEDNEEGVTYEVVCRSMNRERVEKIQKLWEEMGGDDA
jgi:hypothetical protein